MASWQNWVCGACTLALLSCSHGSDRTSAPTQGGVLEAGPNHGPMLDASSEEEEPEREAEAPVDDSAIDSKAPDAAPAPLPSPSTFPSYLSVVFPTENPFSKEKALLGKALFWDEQLSSDDSVACGTCHRPTAGGADPRPAASGYRGHPGPDQVRGTADDPHGSPGIRACSELDDGGVRYELDPVFGSEAQVGKRRSMSFVDAMFFANLFWDGRAEGRVADPEDASVIAIADRGALESQALGPILNDVEMACRGRRWEHVVRKLARVRPLALSPSVTPDLTSWLADHSDYPALFAAAFGDAAITPVRIAMAIATYERTQVGSETAWDVWQKGDRSALSETELRGFAVFQRRAGCQCCHPPPMFGSSLFLNDGFSLSTWDEGRAAITHDSAQTAAFRVPLLRNVGLREPAGVLHDGVGAGVDLDTLVHRYTKAPLTGGGAGICQRGPLNLTEAEIADLLAFLRNGLTDARVAAERAPFDHPTLRHP